MNATMAFGLACSGSVSDNTMGNYAEFVKVNIDKAKALGGWIGEQANRTLDGFNNFLNSKAWELSSRISNDDGKWVGRFDVGYLCGYEAQSSSVGFMRDYIMANPIIMQQYLDENICGFGGEFSNHNSGIAEDNLFYRKATSGLVMGDSKTGYYRKDFVDSLSPDPLSFRQRVDIRRTWESSNLILANGLFDCTNPDHGKLIEPAVEAEDVTE